MAKRLLIQCIRLSSISEIVLFPSSLSRLCTHELDALVHDRRDWVRCHLTLQYAECVIGAQFLADMIAEYVV